MGLTLKGGGDVSTQRRIFKNLRDIPDVSPANLQKLRFLFISDKYDNTGGGSQWRLYNVKSNKSTLDAITTSAYTGSNNPTVLTRAEFGNRPILYFRSDSSTTKPFVFTSTLDEDDFTLFVSYVNQSNQPLTQQRSILGFNCSNGNSLGVNIGGTAATTRVICNGVNKVAVAPAVLTTVNHLAIVYSKATTTLKIFFNGVLDSTFTDVTFLKGLQGPCLLGCSNSGSVLMHGFFAVLQGYASAFTDAEVATQNANIVSAYS